MTSSPDPHAVDELILEQMILAEGEPSADTLARLCEGLVLIPHPWMKGYPKLDLTAGAPPSREQLIGLSLLALGELDTADPRAWEKLKRQPWFRAYCILGDLFYGNDHAALTDQPPALLWMMVDALIEGALVDPMVNHLESATGPVWTALYRCDLPAVDAFPRLWMLAGEAIGISGYDSGSESIVIGDLVERAPDPQTACDWRLRHAYLSWGSEPWNERRTQKLREAVTQAEREGFSTEDSARACEALLSDGYTTVRLPRTAAEVCKAEG